MFVVPTHALSPVSCVVDTERRGKGSEEGREGGMEGEICCLSLF